MKDLYRAERVFIGVFRQVNLLEWLKKLQVHYHVPREFKRYDLCITNGSMEGLSKVFELVINPDDPILVDSPCYSGSLDFVCHRMIQHEEIIRHSPVCLASWIWCGYCQC